MQVALLCHSHSPPYSSTRVALATWLVYASIIMFYFCTFRSRSVLVLVSPSDCVQFPVSSTHSFPFLGSFGSHFHPFRSIFSRSDPFTNFLFEIVSRFLDFLTVDGVLQFKVEFFDAFARGLIGMGVRLVKICSRTTFDALS